MKQSLEIRPYVPEPTAKEPPPVPPPPDPPSAPLYGAEGRKGWSNKKI